MSRSSAGAASMRSAAYAARSSATVDWAIQGQSSRVATEVRAGPRRQPATGSRTALRQRPASLPSHAARISSRAGFSIARCSRLAAAKLAASASAKPSGHAAPMPSPLS